MHESTRVLAGSPREFAFAMRELVERSQRQPATAVSDAAYEMKLRILDYFVERDPQPEAFERALMERIADPNPEKDLSKGICAQILNGWRSRSWYYTPEGKLVLRALYPAEILQVPDEEDS